MTALRNVLLDPDGAFPWAWMYLIVPGSTGVLYRHQCAGVVCEQREMEGYLVPVGGFKTNPADGLVRPRELTAVFHSGSRCSWSGSGERLPVDRQVLLLRLIESIPSWSSDALAFTAHRTGLRFDAARASETAEAWVPVTTPHGPAVLVWPNCD